MVDRSTASGISKHKIIKKCHEKKNCRDANGFSWRMIMMMIIIIIIIIIIMIIIIKIK